MTDQSEKHAPMTEDVEDFEGHKHKEAADIGEKNHPDIAEKHVGRNAGVDDDEADFEGHELSSKHAPDLTERPRDI